MTGYYPIIVLIASIFIIILAFFTTKIVSGGLNANITTNRNIRFIEKLPLGVDKSLVLIQLDEHYYLIFVGKNGAQLIDKLDSLQLKDVKIKNMKFSDILSNIKNLRYK
ncbi:flagellar biosynthetic protein FliO [Paramaledivibacter caminithermalis]|uniref:Flagellar biosynthesis protein, FliO n=1 Tax=Paramaledivibacter caminithermalis (strain DSM 15212 / CIP 107654 / DViRD3) TaxID=1121301 RepID=A0A1M6N6Z0_PARC5|nr:flagellar biosynthetic protein FliO [Paramaledivibacter caminithermalis]SHJ91478.1 Flagellar biosynthesis protein, FliO [Paramaledivibacter caminithermalis DSM 15212]